MMGMMKKSKVMPSTSILKVFDFISMIYLSTLKNNKNNYFCLFLCV